MPRITNRKSPWEGPPSMDTTASFSRKDVHILGLVSAGHFFSHFYTLTLPPLFLFIKDDLNVSFAMLGLLMSVRSFISGSMQIPAGFLVDKLGAKPVLIGGMALMAGSIALTAVVPSYWALMILGITMACGSSVFHPTDYAILNSSVAPKYVGRAFSIHTFAGQLGTATAPAVVVTLAAIWNWRMAQGIVGLAGFVVLAGLASQWSNMHDDAIPQKKKKKAAGSDDSAAPAPTFWQQMAELCTKPMMIMFVFFTMTSLHSGGMTSFFVVGLTALHEATPAAAGTALSGYLLASAFGVLLGGVLADFTKRHDVASAVAFAVSAGVLLLITFVDVGAVLLFLVMTLSGLMQGSIRPARDMMVRALVPKGGMGRAFGFVSSGASIGGAAAPIVFGWLLDIGRPDIVFYLLIVFTLLCVGASIVPKETRDVDVR
jgi:FSR family fosmidomycin resistance protein-like MFS transporter